MPLNKGELEQIVQNKRSEKHQEILKRFSKKIDEVADSFFDRLPEEIREKVLFLDSLLEDVQHNIDGFVIPALRSADDVHQQGERSHSQSLYPYSTRYYRNNTDRIGDAFKVSVGGSAQVFNRAKHAYEWEPSSIRIGIMTRFADKKFSQQVKTVNGEYRAELDHVEGEFQKIFSALETLRGNKKRAEFLRSLGFAVPDATEAAMPSIDVSVFQ